MKVRSIVSALVVPLRAWLLTLSRPGKRALLVCNDTSLLLIAAWLAFSIRWGRPYVPENLTLLVVLLAAPLTGLVVFHAFGLYRLVTRFLGARGALRIQTGVALSVLVWSLVVFMLIGHGERGVVVPRSVIFIYAVLAGLLVWMSREVAGLVLKGVTVATSEPTDRRRVAIFGAGAAGVQLLEALRSSGGYEPVGFVDDQPSLIGQRIGGLKVYRTDKLPRLVERDGVKEVLLAVPERQRRERQQIIREIASHAIRVKTMPAMQDIASGRVSVTDLKPIEVEELLGRDPVPADQDLLARAIRGKSVMVTGAGGSIGFELTRQILRQRPSKLVLFELSESALYEVETEVRDSLAQATSEADTAYQPEIVGVLGSVLESVLLERTIKLYRVQTIYHAAAYKHVPIVEANVVAGLRNNTFGTLTLAEVAERCGVERVTLISTDKAVRPTNVMGASKRLAEQIFQTSAAETAGATVFTMVRFGNVLDSSGSVVRRFRKQIEEGGPVTVTDPNVIRYFMSIPEAATLVIQASAMARGGEVFVLDMGEPVKIDELARTMIRLMGLEVQDEQNPDGDIAIRYIGLRPGEKLFEELLIDERTTETEHPRIRRNNEPFRSRAVLEHDLKTLEAAMAAGRLDTIQAVLSRAVEDYQPDTRATGPEPAAVWLPASRTVH